MIRRHSSLIKIVFLSILAILICLSFSCKGIMKKGDNIENVIIPDKLKPLTPDSVKAVGLNHKVLISWNKINKAESYNIYWSKNPDINIKFAEIITKVKNNLYLHEGLTNGEPYYYVITAMYAKEESEKSTEINVIPNKENNILLDENFESTMMDARLSNKRYGIFEEFPNLKDNASFGSKRAFGFGTAKIKEDTTRVYTSSLKISLLDSTYLSNICFDEIELKGNNGSYGVLYIDGNISTCKFGRIPENDNKPDTQYRTRNYEINQKVKEIEIKVEDIENKSEIFIDNLKIIGKNIFLKTNEIVKAGGYYNMVLKSNRKIIGWGANEKGQLGDSTNINKYIAVEVKELEDVMAISGGGSHSLGLIKDSTVWAWGSNVYGQLGDSTDIDINIPARIKELDDVVIIASGKDHSLGLKCDGTVWGWGGDNSLGQQGEESLNNINIPVEVKNLTNIVAIAGGGRHSLALKNDGTVWAWGSNSYGQLGDSTDIDKKTPIKVKYLNKVKSIACGDNYSLALKSDGSVWSWGNTGYKNYSFQVIPIEITELKSVTAISGGLNHSLALKSNGTVWAWGNNGSGQLGDETEIDKKTPVQVSSLSDILLISAGSIHNIVLKKDGTIWAWGNNVSGQLGKKGLSKSNIPVLIAGIDAIILAPNNLSAKASDQEVTVRWEQDSTLIYNLYWSNTSGVNKNKRTKIINVTSPYLHDNLTNGTTYYYIVTAEKNGAESFESNEAYATPNELPQAPKDVQIEPGDKQLTLTWKAESNIKYNLYWSKNPKVNKNTGYKISNVISPYVHKGLINETAYYYVITAEAKGIEGLDSEEIRGVPFIIPLEPEKVIAEAGDKQVTIYWETQAGLTYNMYWSTNSGVSISNGKKIANVTSPYAHQSGITNGIRYYYIVVAEKNNVVGYPSLTVNAKPNIVPHAPINVTLKAGDEQIEIKWDEDSTQMNTYNIYWLNKEGVSKRNGEKIANVTSPYIHTGLTNEETYYYVVTAEKEEVESVETNEVNIFPFPIPSKTTGLMVQFGEKQLFLEWDKDSTSIYNIYYSTTSVFNKTTGIKISNVTSPYIHSDLINGTTYYYTVVGENKFGEGEESNQVNGTPNPPPVSPSNVILIAEDKQITISWDKVTGVNYNIYWSVNSGVNKNGTKISNATNPYIHTVLTNGTKYYYVITAQNIYGEGIISNEQSAVPYVLPLKPTNVIALGGVSQATISWDKLTGLTYNLYWSTTTGVTKKNGKKISNITSPYVHTELTNGTMYYYIVVAENSFGEGVVSSQVSVMPNSPPVSPSNVASLPGNSKITISWDKVTGLTYNIYWSTSSGVSKNYGTKISNATSPYTHTSLLPGTTYYYIVTASNIYGESVESNQVSTITSFIYLSDNFEYGTGNWFISGSWGTTTSDYYSYNKSITESPIGNYSYLANSAITMKNSINISNVTSPVLSFWHKHNTEYGYDYGLVDISKDNGQTWVNIKEFSGDSYFWIYEEIDLSLYKSSSFKLRFKFTSDTGINYDGWYIDDVEIK